jgi:hypothetical protein
MSQWQYKTDDGGRDTVSFKELAALVREGKVSEGTQVCRAGTMNWEPAWRVPGLFRAAGVVQEGDSPVPAEGGQPGVAIPAAPIPTFSRGERGKSAPTSPRLGLAELGRGLIAAVVGLLAVGFFYRWAWQTTLAFPMPAITVDAELIDCYFPVVGRCTRLECGLLYLDVFVVAALATWYAAAKRIEK